MLNSEDIGQNPNLTSDYPRAFLLYLRHGLRKPNAAGVWGVGHGAQNSLLAIAHRILTAATPFCSLFPPLAALANVPASLSATGALVATIPFVDGLFTDFHPSLAPAAASASLRAGCPGWSQELSVGHDDLGVPFPVFRPSPPVPPILNDRSSPKKQSPAPALSCRGGAPFLLGSVLRANFLYWISMLVFLGRTFWAALGTDTCRMPFSKLAWMSSGITLSPT